MGSIGTTRVEEVMNTTILAVDETEKMEEVATLFKEEDINAAPVLDNKGNCVGIVTSHDWVEYESIREVLQSEFNRGKNYNMAHYGAGAEFRLPGQDYDQVGFHMSRTPESARPEDPLSRVAKQMCAKRVHHVLVLDEKKKLLGILSSLDLLGFVIGEPVSRAAKSQEDTQV